MQPRVDHIVDATTRIEQIERRIISERYPRPQVAMRDLRSVRDLTKVNRNRCSALFARSASSHDRILAQIHANLNRESLWIGCRAVAYPEEAPEEIRLQARERFYARPVRLGDPMGETNHASNEDGGFAGSAR